MAQENWMQNPYTFTGVPSLTPIHLKRRSESNNFGKDSKLFASTNTARRPSTSAGKGNVNPNLHPGLNPNVGLHYMSESSHGHGGSGKPAEIRHPYLVLKRGKKHHAYSADVAPYPLNYETRLLDYDSLDNCAFFSTSTSSSSSNSIGGSNSPSLTPSPSLLQHIVPQDPTTHPRRVLDIGCGSGSWCINAASHWPNTHFVGVDLVAIQPDTLALEKIANLKSAYKNRSFKQPRSRHPSLNPSSSENVGKTKSISTPSPRRSFSISAPNVNAPTGSNTNSDTSTLENMSKITPSSNSVYNRIQWVHHNFLRKRLPFQENEFDLVHVRGIAHGVPEDKWDFLVSELARVLAPGGWLEIIEEDIIFPVVLPPPTLALRRADAAAALQNQSQSQLGHGRSRGAGAEANSAVNSTLNTSNALQDYLEVSRRIATKINQSGQTVQSRQPFASKSSNEGGRRPSLFSPYAYAGVGRASASGLTLPSALDSTSSFEIPSISSYDVLSSEPYPGYLNIPNSYLHYAQTVPALAHSLPPLAVVNPFLHQYHPHSRTYSTQAQSQKDRAVFLQDHVVLEKLYNKVYTKRFINMEPTAILAGVLGMHVELTGIVSSESVEIGRPYARYMDAGSNDTEPRHRGSRRGSGGSRTLLDENADADIEDSDEHEGDGNGLFYDGSGGDSGDRFTGPPSPPLTPTRTATLDGEFTTAITAATSPSKSSSKKRSGKSGASVVSEDFKRFPALALTRRLKETLLGRKSDDEYHDVISNADDSAVKAYHLQRAWENVVACKEAMWEELLADSERRDRDEASPTSPGYSNYADLQSPSPLSASIGGPGGGKTGRSGLSVTGGHPLGDLLVSFPGVSSTPTSDARMAPPWPRSRRVPTLLDELEWVDSDERRTERERFDILINRYDTRIKRYCASAYEHSSLIPPIVARERQALKGPVAMDDSSSSDEEDQGVTRSMLEQQNDASVEGSSGLEAERRKEKIAKDREGHSSSDDVTLAEPQSPNPRTNADSATSASPQGLLSPRLQVPLSQETPSTTAMSSPNSPNSPGVASLFLRTPTVAILPTGKSLKIQVPIKPGHVSGYSISHSRAIGGTGGGIGGNDSHLHAHAHSSSKGKSKEKEWSSLSYTSAESQPSRIVRAFIATKLR